MARISRRRFEGSAATGTALAGARFLFGPSETLASAPRELALAPVEDVVPAACWIGKQDCGMLARRVDGRVVTSSGHPDNPRNLGTLCQSAWSPSTPTPAPPAAAAPTAARPTPSDARTVGR